jgi:hypothetical protein
VIWVLVQKYTRVITILKLSIIKVDLNNISHKRFNLNLACRELEEWLSFQFHFVILLKVKSRKFIHTSSRYVDG